MIVEKIGDYFKQNGKLQDEAVRYEVEKMAGWVFKRQFMDDDRGVTKGKIYLSAVGRCPRQTAYVFHGIEKNGKETDQRAKIVFWMGDLVELTVTNLAKLAGVKLAAVGFQQLHIEMPVNGAMISGYPDGVVFEDKQQLLLEVKSMSSYAFDKFQTGDIDFSYKAQVNAYMEALGLTRCIFVAINKDSGVMAEQIVDKNPVIVELIRKNLLTILHSTPENLPEPPKEYGPDEKGFYTWNCRYCSFWKTCRPNAEEVLVKNSYKLREKQHGDSLRGENAGSGTTDTKVGSGIREVQAVSGESGRPKENSVVRGNAKASRPADVESRSAGKNVRGVQTAS